MAFSMTSEKIALVIVVTIVVLNFCVSLAVALSQAFTARQKATQAILVWLVPLLGAAMIGLFLIVDRSSARYRTNTVGARDIDGYAANFPSATSNGL